MPPKKEEPVCCKAAPGVRCNGKIIQVLGHWYCRYMHMPRCGWTVSEGRVGIRKCWLVPVTVGMDMWNEKRVPLCRMHAPEAREKRAAASAARYKAYTDKLAAPWQRIAELEKEVKRLRRQVKKLQAVSSDA